MKVSIMLYFATRHRRDMPEKSIRRTLTPLNTHPELDGFITSGDNGIGYVLLHSSY